MREETSWDRIAVSRERAAWMLDVEVQTVDKLIRAHELDVMNIGRNVRVVVSSIRAFVDACVKQRLLADK